MNLLRKGYRELSHMADWQVEVWAPSLHELFEQCALAMTGMMKIVPDGKRIEKEIDLKGTDLEELLVNFLSEILYLIEMDKIVPVNYKIHVGMDGLNAKVTATGIRSIGKIIKAVTFHNLQVQHQDSGWMTQIVFDV